MSTVLILVAFVVAILVVLGAGAYVWGYAEVILEDRRKRRSSTD